MTPTILIGNGLSTLVAAAELAGKGHPVTILTDGKNLGGHFAGAQLDGHDFDLGMVLLEESDHRDTGADLSAYDPAVRNDWTRFGGRVSAWMRSRVGLVRAKCPECLVGGRLIPDYLIANKLDGLVGVPKPKQLARTDPRHALNKCAPGLFDSLTYAEAAVANHGELFHDQFIEPFVQKVFGVPSTAFLARFHRAGWVPLYYPETLRAASDGQLTSLSEYPFWTTSGGCVARLVKSMQNTIARSTNVSVVQQTLVSVTKRNSEWTMVTTDGRSYRTERLSIGLPLGRAGSLLNLPIENPKSAASVVLLLAVVDAARIRIPHGCTMIVDQAYAAYRLTDHDALAGVDDALHRVTLEASPLAVARLYANQTEQYALKGELANLMGIDINHPRDRDAIRISRCVTARDAVAIPTPDHVAQANIAATSISQSAEGALLSGSLLGYGATSMNDQIVQGLRIAEQFS